MSVFHDEVEIEDFEFDEEAEIYYYPCPCGDRFEITREMLADGEEVATCPSCSLIIKVIYDIVSSPTPSMLRDKLIVQGALKILNKLNLQEITLNYFLPSNQTTTNFLALRSLGPF